MRLGEQECKLQPGSLIHEVYGRELIAERHRHRYEFNNTFMQILQDAGLSFTGKSTDDALVEVIEIEDHPWFVGCQFHPEFTSTPRSGHPMFSGFVKAARRYHGNQVTPSKEAATQDQEASPDSVTQAEGTKL